MNFPYQGWPNWPTWCVSIWLNRDDDNYRELVSILDQHEDDNAAGRAIRRWVYDSSPLPLADASDMFAELLSYTLAHVDWRFIAEKNRSIEEK